MVSLMLTDEPRKASILGVVVSLYVRSVRLTSFSLVTLCGVSKRAKATRW